jgi:hypothetical protein
MITPKDIYNAQKALFDEHYKRCIETPPLLAGIAVVLNTRTDYKEIKIQVKQ